MTQQTTTEPVTSDVAAIRQTALDYIEGYQEGDAERMRRSLHPELAKRAILRDPQTGAERFSHLTQQRMVERTEQGGGTDIPPEKRYYDVAILDVSGEIASARVESYEYIDYLHLARSEGRWVIVNVLWANRSVER